MADIVVHGTDSTRLAMPGNKSVRLRGRVLGSACRDRLQLGVLTSFCRDILLPAHVAVMTSRTLQRSMADHRSSSCCVCLMLTGTLCSAAKGKDDLRACFTTNVNQNTQAYAFVSTHY